MIDPLALRPDTTPRVRENFQRRWDKKQARLKKDELHELHVLLGRAENQMTLTPLQKKRLEVLFKKYKDEESPT